MVCRAAATAPDLEVVEAAAGHRSGRGILKFNDAEMVPSDAPADLEQASLVPLLKSGNKIKNNFVASQYMQNFGQPRAYLY